MKEYREKNPERVRGWQRAYTQKNLQSERDRKRALRWRTVYGIEFTTEQYNEMLEQQDGLCLLCDGPPRKVRLHVDHDHETGVIRGLLCTSCNTKLGWYEIHKEEIRDYLSR